MPKSGFPFLNQEGLVMGDFLSNAFFISNLDDSSTYHHRSEIRQSLNMILNSKVEWADLNFLM